MMTLPLSPAHSARLLSKIVLRSLGGTGSGNFGHQGRSGKRGGSSVGPSYSTMGVPEHGEDQINIMLRVAGGAGSGNFGHAGRPGEVGGSTSNWIGNGSFISKPFPPGVARALRAYTDRGIKIHSALVLDSNVEESSKSVTEALITQGWKLSEEVPINEDEESFANELQFSRSTEWMNLYLHSYGVRTLLVGDMTPMDAGGRLHTDPVYVPPALRGLGGKGSGNHGHAGRPGQRGGSAVGGLRLSHQTALDGDRTSSLTKLETGALGEEIAIAYLKQEGNKGARTLNVRGNNFPVDLVEDHHVWEVKASLASNGPTAEHWRATIGQPGKKEAKWLAKASDRAKRKWNERKKNEILERKEHAVLTVSAKLGHKVKGGTIALIVNPSTRVVDIHVFDGFHHRIGWKSDLAKEGYRGSFRY